MTIEIVDISFPDIPLRTRDGHKLRGFFGNLFREHSPLLHNHFEDGSLRYAYPLVQYKVIKRIAHLTGLNEGAELLMELFLRIRELDIDGNKYPVLSKNIVKQNFKLYDTGKISHYRFVNPWMALNQDNYKKYINLSREEQKQLLQRILTGNILSFYKSMGYRTNTGINVLINVKEKQTLFKNKKMLAFEGEFATNALLPDLIGLGKAVSRGFGTIKKLS